METNRIYLGDSYKLIKELPDKSIDLIYTDIPYLMETGGGGKSALSQRIQKYNFELGNENSKRSMELSIERLEEQMEKATTPEEYEKYRIQKNNIQNRLNLKRANIVNGIDYSIFDEFCRVLKHIYIYLV